MINRKQPIWIGIMLLTASFVLGSIVDVHNQTLRQAIPIVGTELSICYNSTRMPGYTASNSIVIPLTKENFPSALNMVVLDITIAGKKVSKQFMPSANLKYTFTWDGKDAYGRLLRGQQKVQVDIGYVYDLTYKTPSEFDGSFAQISNGQPFTANKSDRTITMWQTTSMEIGTPLSQQSIKGLGFNNVHTYDFDYHELCLGDGSVYRIPLMQSSIVKSIAGTGVQGSSDGNAKYATFHSPSGIAVDKDGNVYISESAKIRKLDTTGLVTTIAGNGTYGYSGDGGVATRALVYGGGDVEVDKNGVIYFEDYARIRKISPTGIITTIAGNGTSGYSGDGGLAINANIRAYGGLAISDDGCIYFCDRDHYVVRRIDANGIITTIAGNGTYDYEWKGGGPATKIALGQPTSIDFGSDGTLYIAINQGYVLHVRKDGYIEKVAGNDHFSWIDEYTQNKPAVSAKIRGIQALDVAKDRTITIVTYDFMHKIDINGTITTVAGDTNQLTQEKDGVNGWNFPFNIVGDIEGLQDGSILFAIPNSSVIWKYIPALSYLSNNDAIMPSEDGSELYVFNSGGKHLRTLDAITGKPFWTFQYDSTSGLLSSMVNGVGDTTKIERNPDGTPTAIVAPHGERTTLTVDGNGYLNSVTNPANETVSMTYTDKGMMTSFTDGENSRSTFAYDDLGQLTDDVNQLGGYVRLERQNIENGFKVIKREYKDNTDEYTTTYTVETLPDGTTKRTTVGCCGGPVESTTGPDGTETSRMPNGTVTVTKKGPDPRFGMLAPITTETKVTLPSGKTTTTTHKRGAVMTNKNDPLSFTSIADTVITDGAMTVTTYTKATRTIVTNSPMGKTVTTVLDTMGQVIRDSVAGMDPVTYSYDTKGQLIAVTQGTGANVRTSTITYDKGRAIKATDPLNQVTSFGYDLAGRLVSKTLPDGQVISFDHNKNGAITAVTPPARGAHQFAYDAGQNLTQYTAPTIADGDNKTGYTYNKNGQVTAVTRPDGLVTSYDYDALGRVSKVSMPTDTVNYVYDAKSNNLTAVGNKSSAISYTYDGGVLTKAQWSGSVNGSVGVRFNAKMQVDTQSVNDGNKIGFVYDADGSLTKAGELTIKRDGTNGRLTGTVLGNLKDTLIYDAAGNLTDYRVTNGVNTLFREEGTSYDKLGRLAEKRETVDGISATYAYKYDAVGQLIEVRKDGSVVESYSYDANGNRLGGTVDGQDRLLSDGTATYTYTANGELKTKTVGTEVTSYEYDVQGNLVKTTLPNGAVLENVIDPAGRIISRKVNGAVVNSLLWESALRPAAMLDASGAVTARFVYGTGINVPDYMVKDGVTYRFVKDRLGSVRAVVNGSTGELVQKIEYDSYGKVLSNSNPDFQPFGFAGGLYESKTGLVRFGARDYDANSGRWTDKEPLGFAGDENFYRYCGNDPVSYIDIDGFQKKPATNILNYDGGGNGNGGGGARLFGKPEGNVQPYGPTNGTPTSCGLQRAPKSSSPNSIYEQRSNSGDLRSRSFYDSQGNRFNRQDFDHEHGGMKPHEHIFTLNINNQQIKPEIIIPLRPGYSK